MELSIVEGLALHTMRSHGLIDAGWQFQWDSASKRFGLCNYRTRTISMSSSLTLANTFSAARDTVSHEVAHALTPGAGHGISWKRKAVELGAAPKACFSWDEVVPPGEHYVLFCPSCGFRKRYHERPSSRLFCYRCCTVFSNKRVDSRFTLLVERSFEYQARPEVLLENARSSLFKLLDAYVHSGMNISLLRSCINAKHNLSQSPFECRRLWSSPLKVKANVLLKTPLNYPFDALLVFDRQPTLGISLATSPTATSPDCSFPWVTLSAGQLGYSQPFQILATNVPARFCKVCAEAVVPRK